MPDYPGCPGKRPLNGCSTHLSSTVFELWRVICRKSPTLTYSTCIYRLCWGDPHPSFADIFGIRKLESNPTFSRFSRTPTCDRQTYDYSTYHASMASCGNNKKQKYWCHLHIYCMMLNAKKIPNLYHHVFPLWRPGHTYNGTITNLILIAIYNYKMTVVYWVLIVTNGAQ